MNDKLNARRLAERSQEMQELLGLRSIGSLVAIGVVFCLVFVLALITPAQEGSPAAQMAAAPETCFGACVEGE